jgi:hypothetical protein
MMSEKQRTALREVEPGILVEWIERLDHRVDLLKDLLLDELRRRPVAMPVPR